MRLAAAAPDDPAVQPIATGPVKERPPGARTDCEAWVCEVRGRIRVGVKVRVRARVRVRVKRRGLGL